jgi:hypothetical protein
VATVCKPKPGRSIFGVRLPGVLWGLLLALACAMPIWAQTPGSGSINVNLETFGVGNVSRPGEWVGVRLRLTDSSPRERDVLVRIALPDADGDTMVAERKITLNPGVAQGTWLYFRIPFRFDANREATGSVYEAIVPDDADAAAGFVSGRLLARQPIAPAPANSLLPKTMGVLGVIGNDELGLKRYAVRSDGGSLSGTYTPYAHEATELAPGLAPASLPDRWMGYAPMWALVWGPSVEPSQIRGEQARAIREWVERGGHLVIVLPSIAQQWTNPESNELHDILPVVTVNRREGIDYEPYRPLLQHVRSNDLTRDKGVVHVFEPMATASPNEAIRVLNGPDGACVVARRLVGSGMVTLVGLDLASNSVRSATRADVFWHRVFGRRGSLEGGTAESLTQAAAQPRDIAVYDADIVGLIEKRGRAAGGVLLGFVVFIIYWLIAGPAGFALLKARQQTRHAWLAFVVASALFTLLAWGGASLLRPARVEASHVTFLDHVYGQPLSRARTWVSILLPKYGDSRIAIGDPAELGDRRSPGVIAPWDQPQDEAIAVSFPDSRQYIVDAREWESMRVPSRWTIKQVQADWSGGPRWKMPRPVLAGTQTEGKLEVVANAPTESRGMVQGVLRHEMPGTLKDVFIVVVRSQTDLAPVIDPPSTAQALRAAMSRGPLYSNAFVFQYPAWPANEEIDLGIITRGKQGDGAAEIALKSRFSPSTDSGTAMTGFGQRASPPRDWLSAVAFMTVLDPPRLDGSTSAGDRASALRMLTHGLDLGRWFTQPCVIVIGRMDDKEPGGSGESPVPIAVDGVLAPTNGTTMVRWIYPLSDAPPAFREAQPEIGLPAGDPLAEPLVDNDQSPLS